MSQDNKTGDEMGTMPTFIVRYTYPGSGNGLAYTTLVRVPRSELLASNEASNVEVARLAADRLGRKVVVIDVVSANPDPALLGKGRIGWLNGRAATTIVTEPPSEPRLTGGALATVG